MTIRRVVGAIAVGALVTVASVSVSGAGAPNRDLVVVPTEVAYDELFTVSGEGCFTAVAFRMPEVPFSSRQVTVEADGTWEVLMSVPSEAGIPPGPKTIEAECLGDVVTGLSTPSQAAPGFSYNDAVVTVVAAGPTTTTTTTPEAPSTTGSGAEPATAVASRPAFTG